MKISRRNQYQLLALVLVVLMICDRISKRDQSSRLRDAIQCFIEQKGAGEFCPEISVEPILQKSIQKKFIHKFNQTKPTFSISSKGEIFQIHIQSSKGSGIVLGVTLKSKSDFQIVSWKDWDQGDES